MSKEQILNVIQRIRESFDDSVRVYTQGRCVAFAMILKELLPAGEIIYDHNHAIFEYEGACYDITGEVEKTPRHIPVWMYGEVGGYRFSPPEDKQSD